MAFIREQEGISIHFASREKDIEGSGKILIQYSHVEVKEDLLHWLKENGRLPSTNIDQYFNEINNYNSAVKKVEELTH